MSVNYKHLHYFWTVAKEGSIAKASERLHLTPQTISGQLSLLEDYYGVKLFKKVGRSLQLSQVGHQVLTYADEIFSLGNELEEMMRDQPSFHRPVLKVGIVDLVPKSIAHQILLPALKAENEIKMICREASFDTLISELSSHSLDLVIAERDIPSNVSNRGFSHKLGQSSISFFATQALQSQLVGSFPECLHNAPMLIPTSGNQLRPSLNKWLTKYHLRPKIIAEFDDSALMKAFGKEGVGVFIAPTAISSEVQEQYGVSCIGQTDEIQEKFYIISIERKIKNPIVSEIIETANTALFYE